VSGRSSFALGAAALDADDIDEAAPEEADSPKGTEDATPAVEADATLPEADTLVYAPDSLPASALPPPSADPKVHRPVAGSLTAQPT
jgi:hypothetical protein